jgi:rubrerythrin
MFTPFNNQMNNQQNNQKFMEEKTSRLASDNFLTLQNARKDLVGEIEAIIQYDDHIYSTTSDVAKQTWTVIRNEEMTHVGELLALLNYLDPNQKQYVEEGISEFNEQTGQSSSQKK